MRNRILWWSAGPCAALSVALLTAGGNPPAGPDSDPPPEAAGAEVLTRGPLHEAFAAPVVFDATAGLTCPKQPPEAIEELPPDRRPDGDAVVWVPGYWGWDDDRADFVWVSGIWRNLPPGREWRPGYWNKTDDGFQWISGFWAPTASAEVEYLAPPPASVEAGPSSEPPAADRIWAPGNWQWVETRYAWRPGYWYAPQENWTWVPAHYAWTPRGCVFVEGYWDHAVEDRGLIFAPVYFEAGVYSRPGFRYSPRTCIDVRVVLGCFFSRPSYCHYYYGDYYEARYSKGGIYPWFAVHNSRHSYDPIYSYESWHNRGDAKWSVRIQADFVQRRDNPAARPPRTYVAQQTIINNTTNVNVNIRTTTVNNFYIGKTTTQISAEKGSNVRLVKLEPARRTEIAQHTVAVRKVTEERHQLEVQVSAKVTVGQAAKPSRVALPHTPVMSRSASAKAAPAAPAASAPDHSVKHPAPGQASPRPEPRLPAESKHEPKAETKHEPKAEPKAQPKVEPRSEPKAEPKHEPKAEPKSQPKAEPKHEPKPEPKSAEPKHEPKAQPKGEPKSEPKGEPKA